MHGAKRPKILVYYILFPSVYPAYTIRSTRGSIYILSYTWKLEKHKGDKVLLRLFHNMLNFKLIEINDTQNSPVNLIFDGFTI